VPGPLDGIRVLDLSRVLAGPHCGRILSDLGADVIKLEPPDGDLARRARPRRADISIFFTQQNVGKRNVSIDLSRPEGTGLALRLAVASDVVLENFRPGVADRLGVGYEAVRAQNLGVVYCSITGYGRAVPRRAYAPVVHAEAGLTEVQARKHGRDPRTDAVSHADVYAGLRASIGICAALTRRERTGEGSRVDISMAEGLLAANEWTAVEWAGESSDIPQVFGTWSSLIARTADGTWVCVSGNPAGSFPAWARVMGRPELVEDERFATPQARHEHTDEMLVVLREYVASFPNVDALEEKIGEEQFAVGAIRSGTDALSSEWGPSTTIEVDDRIGGTLRVPGNAIDFEGLDIGPRRNTAYQGEHNREVLMELLGLTDGEIDALESDGILASRPPRG
jgi:CoA:oxalate CoA-transferase